jgi:hypothetical protein
MEAFGPETSEVARATSYVAPVEPAPLPAPVPPPSASRPAVGRKLFAAFTTPQRPLWLVVLLVVALIAGIGVGVVVTRSFGLQSASSQSP